MSEKKERKLFIKIGKYVIAVCSFGWHVCHVSLSACGELERSSTGHRASFTPEITEYTFPKFPQAPFIKQSEKEGRKAMWI